MSGATSAGRGDDMLLTLLAIVWVLIWAVCVFDVLRRPDLTTGMKVLWAVVVLLVPILGILAYVVVRPKEPTAPYAPSANASPEERVRGRHPV